MKIRFKNVTYFGKNCQKENNFMIYITEQNILMGHSMIDVQGWGEGGKGVRRKPHADIQKSC